MVASSYVLRADESVHPLGPFRLMVDAEVSDGRLTLYQGTLPPGGPPLHSHDFDEILLVLEGRMLLQLDGETTEVGEGDFAWMPAGSVHTFANPGHGQVRGLGLALPSGVEKLFAERGRYIAGLGDGETPDMERIAEIYAAHASTVHGPPLKF